MENSQNLEILAESSLISKNFTQAFDYYSKLLEFDTAKSNYWIGKGIASGWLSSPDYPRFEELTSCIKTADNLKQLTSEEKQKVTFEICDITIVKLKEILDHIDKEINKEFDTKAIGTGTLHAVHQTGKLSIQLSVGNKYSPKLIAAINASKFASEIYPTEYTLSTLIKLIDQVIQHSANNVNYFKTHKDAGDRFDKIQDIRTSATIKFKEINPNVNVPNAPSSSNSSCFIATAATGDINHSSVIQLRHFRDSVLLNYPLGQKFIEEYYKYSPALADKLRKNYILKKFTYYFVVKPISSITRLLMKK